MTLSVIEIIFLLQAFSSAIFRICGASRGPSASAELLVYQSVINFSAVISYGTSPLTADSDKNSDKILTNSCTKCCLSCMRIETAITHVVQIGHNGLNFYRHFRLLFFQARSFAFGCLQLAFHLGKPCAKLAPEQPR